MRPTNSRFTFTRGKKSSPEMIFRWDLYLSTRNDLGDDFGNPVPLTGVNTTAGTEWYPSVSSDGQFIFFSDYGTGLRTDTGSRGDVDVWFGTLNSTTGTFENVLNVGTPINSGSHDGCFDVSADWPADGSMVYFYLQSSRRWPG